eukprot:455594_1
MFQILSVLCVLVIFIWIKISDIHIEIPGHDHIGDTLTHSNTVFYYDYANGMPHKYILNNTERIKYYMGKWYNNSISIEDNNVKVHHMEQICDNKDAMMTNNDITFIIFQQFQHIHVFSTTRYINDYPIIIKPFKQDKDWNTAIQIYNGEIYDPLWNNKIYKVIWRGTLTGFKTEFFRMSFVEQYYNNGNSFDVGLTQITSFANNESMKYKLEPFIRPQVSIENQLKHKYIVYIEGNNMTTTLKWILMSNSVVFMPIVTTETWIMEGLLIPYIHFIPITFNETTNKWDLEQQYEFCLDNDDYCNQIAQNGRSFLIKNKFFDGDNEKNIQKQIIDIYCKVNNVSFGY